MPLIYCHVVKIKHLIKNVLYGQSKNTLSFCFVKIGSNAACGSGSDSAGEKNPSKKQKKKKKIFFFSDFGPLINVPYIVMISYKMRILEAVN